MAKIRVLLAEDHETVRQGLKLLIDHQPDMEVVGEAGDGRMAVERAEALRPNVVVVDISMPEMNGLAATRAIRAAAPATAVVALTRYGDDAYVQELLNAGALGYVLKQSPSGELVDAVRAAARGPSVPRPQPGGEGRGSDAEPSRRSRSTGPDYRPRDTGAAADGAWDTAIRTSRIRSS